MPLAVEGQAQQQRVKQQGEQQRKSQLFALRNAQLTQPQAAACDLRNLRWIPSRGAGSRGGCGCSHASLIVICRSGQPLVVEPRPFLYRPDGRRASMQRIDQDVVFLGNDH